jgi:hypothetical protein
VMFSTSFPLTRQRLSAKRANLKNARIVNGKNSNLLLLSYACVAWAKFKFRADGDDNDDINDSKSFVDPKPALRNTLSMQSASWVMRPGHDSISFLRIRSITLSIGLDETMMLLVNQELQRILVSNELRHWNKSGFVLKRS